MARAATRVVTAHVPVSLAEKVDQTADSLERSRGWIMKPPLWEQIVSDRLLDAELRVLAERFESAIRTRMQVSIFEVVGSGPDRP